MSKAASTLIVAMAAVAPAGRVSAQVLYDNANLRTGTLSENGFTAAPAGWQWSELQHDAGITTIANNLNGASANQQGGFRLADNFTVPAGQLWQISSISLYAYKTDYLAGTTPVDAYTLRIWSGRPGDLGSTIVFGDTVTNRLTNSVNHQTYRMVNSMVPVASATQPNTNRRIWKQTVSTLSSVSSGTTLNLIPGTYWIDWDSSDTANGAHFSPLATAIGSRTLPGWNGRQFDGSTQLWKDLNDEGNPANPPLSFVIMDLPFQVNGTLGNNCQVPLPLSCKGDVFPPGSPSGSVNIDDLVAVISHWNQTGPPRPIGDCAPGTMGDCTVNIDDLVKVITEWGSCPTNGACCINGSCSLQNQATCIAASGTFFGVGTTCTVGLCPQPPVNDLCANATTAVIGANSWNNTNANLDGPVVTCTSNPTRDVWFNFTSTCTGHITFTTQGTAVPFIDTILEVYSGTGCNPLGAVLGCGDDINSTNHLSSVTVDLTTGQAVKVRCMSFGTSASNQGPATLGISCAPLDNNNCTDAQLIAIGSTTNASMVGATADTAPTCMGIQPGSGRWYKLVGNGHNLRACTCDSPLEGWDGRLLVYCVDPANPCTTLTCVAANATFDCGPSPGGCTTPTSGFGTQESVTWCAVNGQTYFILVSTDFAPSLPEGNYTLKVTDLGTNCAGGPACAGAPPVNDECATASTVVLGVNNISNLNATTSAGVPTSGPTCAGTTHSEFTRDVWFKYTPNFTGNARIDTCNSAGSLDSMLAAYTSSAGGLCPPVTPLACDDDGCDFGSYSVLTVVPVTNGVPIFIRVGSWNNSTSGSMVLTIANAGTPPVNDECAGATVVSCGSTVTVTAAQYPNYTAIVSDPQPTCSAQCGAPPAACAKDKSWWYRITTGAAQTQLKLSYCTSDPSLDTLLSVWSGACGALAQVACDDDTCVVSPNFGPSTLCITVSPNTTYFILVQHYAPAQVGDYTLNVSCTCP